jgi:hypothetical protein
MFSISDLRCFIFAYFFHLKVQRSIQQRLQVSLTLDFKRHIPANDLGSMTLWLTFDPC